MAEICVEGCKGEGGNLCPDGKECTSKDSTIGECIDLTGTGGSGGGAGGAGGGGGADPGDNGQCGCSLPGSDTRDFGGALAALGLAAFAMRRRRKSDSV